MKDFTNVIAWRQIKVRSVQFNSISCHNLFIKSKTKVKPFQLIFLWEHDWSLFKKSFEMIFLTFRLRIDEERLDASRRPFSGPSDWKWRFKIFKEKNQNEEVLEVQHFAKNRLLQLNWTDVNFERMKNFLINQIF